MVNIATVLAFVLIVLANATLFVVVNRLLFPRVSPPAHSAPAKADLFECGVEWTTPPPIRYPVRFYRLAIVFVLLDIELAFFLPWAVLVRDLGWPGVFLMTFYAGLLVIGLIYFWRHGGLQIWGPPEEAIRPRLRELIRRRAQFGTVPPQT